MDLQLFVVHLLRLSTQHVHALGGLEVALIEFGVPEKRIQRREIVLGTAPNAGRHEDTARRPAAAAVGGNAKSKAFEYQRAVGAAKAKRILERDSNRHVSRKICTVVQIACRIRREDIGGWRRYLVAYGQYSDH